MRVSQPWRERGRERGCVGHGVQARRPTSSGRCMQGALRLIDGLAVSM
jgi:hypothetical protein